MDTLKSIVTKYCKEYVRTNSEAKRFMTYYAPDLNEMYEIEDEEAFEYDEKLHQFINNDLDDDRLQIIVDDLFDFYFLNRPY